MTEVEAATGAALAWLGACLFTAADGRRGLALGLALVTAGLGLGAIGSGQAPSGVAVLAAGGLAGAALRLRGGQPGWIVMPPGSTPRVMTAIVVLIGVSLVAGSELGSPAGAARFASLVVAVIAGVRLLNVDQPWAALAAGSALALGLGTLGGPVAVVAGAVTAAVLGALDPAARSAESAR